MTYRITLKLLLWIALLTIPANNFAEELLDNQKKALKVIEEFAGNLCDEIPSEGSSSNLELTGAAKVKLDTLLKRLVTLGLDGAVKYQGVEYKGILQKDLALLLQERNKCKLEVFRILQNKLIPVPAISPQKTSRENKTAIPANIKTMWVFYQDKKQLDFSGCTRPHDPAGITPKEFNERIDEFIRQAKQLNNSLIITAFSQSLGWSAGEEIKINGEKLIPMRPYYCNGKRDYGYEYIY